MLQEEGRVRRRGLRVLISSMGTFTSGHQSSGKPSSRHFSVSVSVVQMGMFSNSKQLYLYSGLINSVERLHEPRTSASLASRSYSFEFKGPTRYYITSFPYLCFSSFYLCVCDIILSIGTKCKSWSSRAQPLIRLLFIFFLFYYLYKIKALPRDRWDSQFSTDANHV